MNLNADLIFIRHGESNGNLGIREPGVHPDDPHLTPLGLWQAQKIADRFVPGEVSAIYTSALMRACQTMQPTAQKLGISMHVLRELMEVGTEIPNTDPEQVKQLAPNAYDGLCRILTAPETFSAADGTPQTCEKRAAYCIDRILADCKDGDRIVICTHGGFIGYLIRYCLGLSLPEPFNWQIDNGAAFIIRFYQDQIPKLVRANDIAHLK